MANTLYEYYKSQGQALPSVADRQGIASKAGIANYTGDETQNASLLGYLKGTPTTGTTDNVITGDNLKSDVPITVPAPKPDTASMGISSAVTNLSKTLKDQITTDEADYKKQQEEVLKGIKESGDQTTFNNKVIADSGVDTLKKSSDILTSEIESLQKEEKDQIESLLGNGGVTREQVQPQIDAIRRKYANLQAEKGIALSGIARQYDTASSIANRAISANADRVKTELEAKKFVLEQLGTKLGTERANSFTLQIKQIDNEQKLLESAIKTATDGLKDGSIDNAIGTKAIQDLTSGKVSISDFYKNINKDEDSPDTQYGVDIGAWNPVDKQYAQKVLAIADGIGNITTVGEANDEIAKLSPNSPITGEMLLASAKKYGIDPKIMLAMLSQESTVGTSNVAKNNNNPTGITWSSTLQSNFPNIDISKGTARPSGEGGNYAKFKTLQDGLDFQASWLKKHPKAPDTSQDYIYGDFKTTLSEQGVKAFDMLKNNDKSAVMQLVNGDILIADLVKSRGKEGTAEVKRLTQLAQKVDPSYSPATEKIRYEYKKNWELDSVKGNVGTKNAINTALGHLADLSKSSKNLPEGTVRKMNSVKNVLNKEFGDPAVTDFRINLNALATELARVYKGGVPNEGEIKEWQQSLAENFSQKQFDGAFNKTSELLTSKITALRYGYKSAMGREYNQSLIDPDKKQALIDAGINIDSIAKEKISADDPFLQSFQENNAPIVPPATSTDFYGDLLKSLNIKL